MTVPPTDGVDALQSPDAPVTDPPPCTGRPPLWHGQVSVVAVVSLGGAIGAVARYGASRIWPGQPGVFPWTTFWVNVIGCFVIGLLIVAITEIWDVHPLMRPFFGTGVLGGFTTFSTYAVDIERQIAAGHPSIALAYLAATLLAALTAVWLAVTLARAVAPGTRAVAPEKGKKSS
ncbi:fluoride efflux transporter CrcB [Streptomyces sp. NPDC002643]